LAIVTIGDDVRIGPYVQLLTATHPLDPQMRREQWESAAPVTIEDNVWLGGGAIVCPGVTIGANTVVGAGSVVTRDLLADVIAMGLTARTSAVRRRAATPTPKDRASQTERQPLPSGQYISGYLAIRWDPKGWG
jgi:acetyltransferase-like isoleucine patch superfamily enzyme